MSEHTLNGPSAERIENEQAQEYFSFFVENACPPDASGVVTPEAIKATAETLILLHSGELPYQPHSENPRDQAVEKVQVAGAGMPKSREEVKDIIETPKRRFASAVRRQKGRRAAYSRIDGFRKDALQDTKNLREVMTVNDDGKVMPNVDLLRQSPAAIYAAADFLQARQALDEGEWPAKNTHKYKNSQKYWRGLMIAAARYAGPSTVAMAVDDAWRQAGDRLRYFTEQVREISKTVGGQAVKQMLEQDKTAGDRTPEPAETEAVEPDPKAEQADADDPYGSRIPEHIKRNLISQYAHKAARIETQVRQGTPRHLAELRVLGGPGLYDTNGDLIGFIPADDQPSAAALVAAETRKRPNAANSPYVRSQPGYDKRPDK